MDTMTSKYDCLITNIAEYLLSPWLFFERLTLAPAERAAYQSCPNGLRTLDKGRHLTWCDLTRFPFIKCLNLGSKTITKGVHWKPDWEACFHSVHTEVRRERRLEMCGPCGWGGREHICVSDLALGVSAPLETWASIPPWVPGDFSVSVPQLTILPKLNEWVLLLETKESLIKILILTKILTVNLDMERDSQNLTYGWRCLINEISICLLWTGYHQMVTATVWLFITSAFLGLYHLS